MTRPLKIVITITDVAFILYWTMATLSELNAIEVPPNLMYADYDHPRVVAWNWSFLPIDLVFSIVGLAAVNASRRGSPVWRPLAIISLTLTLAEGGMAVSYWAILREFDPAWFIPNLALVVWPLWFLPRLVKDTAASRNVASG